MFDIKIKKNQFDRRIKKMKRRIKNKTPFFKMLSVWVRNSTIKLFKGQGGQYGRSAWLSIAPSMFGRIRYGTDLKPRGSRGHRIPSIRRFDSSSQPLMASGGFMKSFKTLSVGRNNLRFGSELQINGKSAKMIQFAGRGKKNPRYVLPKWESPSAKSETNRLVKRFLNYLTGKKDSI